jgi:hypothetical protein
MTGIILRNQAPDFAGAEEALIAEATTDREVIHDNTERF